MNKTELKTILGILKIPVNPENFDFEQENDERESGGVWDLSFYIADYLLDDLYTIPDTGDDYHDNRFGRTLDDTRDEISELLYNLIKK